MRPTINKLDVFYRSPTSTFISDILSRKLHARWPDLSGQDVLGYGFCEKYLSSYKKTANRIILTLPEKNLTKIQYDDMLQAFLYLLFQLEPLLFENQYPTSLAHLFVLLCSFLLNLKKIVATLPDNDHQ